MGFVFKSMRNECKLFGIVKKVMYTKNIRIERINETKEKKKTEVNRVETFKKRGGKVML